jgi:metal-responsive CopG/Arc/MetJ family transcriptional regulator
MSTSSRKINLNIDEEVYKALEALIPSGKRSQVINEALRKEIELIRRRQSIAKLSAAAKVMKRLSNREIVQQLGQDRGRH